MENESKTAFEKRMKTITVPEGFTTSFGEDIWGFGEQTTVNPFFKLSKTNDVEFKFDLNGSGHTSFHTAKGVLTFDRRGVEDSFYHVPFSFTNKASKPLSGAALDTLVQEQLDKVAKRREYYALAIVIPGLPGGHTVAPEGVEGLKKQLANANGHLTFTPAGFGTGYCVTKKPTRGLRYGETRAKPELEAFLGVSPLYVHTLDCD